MTSQSNTPLTIPPCSDPVNVDLAAIRANWERVKAQLPHDVVRKHIDFHTKQGNTEIVMALNLLWNDMHFLFGGGWQKMQEKK